MFQRDHDSKTCTNCDRKTGETGNCTDCGKVICSECAGCEIVGVLTCNTCIDDLLAPGHDEELSEPECECVQIDVDLVDNRSCEAHGGKAPSYGGWR